MFVRMISFDFTDSILPQRETFEVYPHICLYHIYIYSCIEVIYFQPTRLLEFPWRITQVWFKDIRVAMAQGYLSILNLVVPQWIRQLCCLIRLPPAALLQLAIPPTGHPHVWPPNKSMMTGQPPESPEFELRLGKF